MTSETRPISGAELKVWLTALGLSPPWFAKRMGVTTRTVHRWCELDELAPPLCPQAPRITAVMDEISRETLNEMRAMASGAILDPALYTYRTDSDIVYGMPASWHRALTFRVLEHLKAQGKDVTVRYVA